MALAQSLKHRYTFASGYEAGSKIVQGRVGRPVHIAQRKVWQAGFDAARAGKRQSEAYKALQESEQLQDQIDQLKESAEPTAGDMQDALNPDDDWDPGFMDDADMDDADVDGADSDDADIDDAEIDDSEYDNADQDDADRYA